MQPSHDSQCNSLQPVFCREYTTETTFSQCTSHKPWIFLLTMRVLEEVCIWVDPIQMGDNDEPANPGVPLLSDSYSVENLTICATQYMIAKTELSIQYNPFYSFLPNFLCNPSNFELSYLPILRISTLVARYLHSLHPLFEIPVRFMWSVPTSSGACTIHITSDRELGRQPIS